MNWKTSCLAALDHAKLFENPKHRSRFKELLDCYGTQPFFTKGLCKCFYLSAWDEEHFCIMLETLMNMSLGQETDTDDMRLSGNQLALQQTDEQVYVYRLSSSFLAEEPFQLDPQVVLSPEFSHIIRQALSASEIIDGL